MAKARAQFNRGDFWGSHEALEMAWHAAPEPDRDFLQGLIQGAAALHKYVVQDNIRGARRLLDMSLTRLDRYPTGHHGLALGALRGELRAWSERMHRSGAVGGTVVGLPRMEWSTSGLAQMLRVEVIDLRLVEHRGRRAVLVAVDAGNHVGWGECRTRWGAYGLWESLTNGLAPAVLADPLAAPPELTLTWSDTEVDPFALAGVEAALWDLWARQHGWSLAVALGFAPRAVPLAGRVAAGDPLGLAEALDTVARCNAQLIILPARPNADRRLLPALAAPLEVPIAIDLGAAYRPADIEALTVLDGMGARFLAQPAPTHDAAGLIRLRRWLTTPVSGGGWRDAREARSAVEMGALDILHVDPGMCGLSAAVDVAMVAEERHLPLWVASTAVTPVGALADLALAAHPAATLPADLTAARGADGRRALEPDGDGTVRPPDGPGLGFVPDPGWLDAVTVRRATLRA